jgi:hypothetical protein
MTGPFLPHTLEVGLSADDWQTLRAVGRVLDLTDTETAALLLHRCSAALRAQGVRPVIATLDELSKPEHS